MFALPVSDPDPTPPDCFGLAELQALQSFEAQELADVNYYLWLNRSETGAVPYRFLYCLELIFDVSGALLLCSGEDSAAIRLLPAEALIKTARELQTLHGQASIQRVNAGAFPLWQAAVGHVLHAVRLTRNAQGLYLNDALVLDFGQRCMFVRLSLQEGLELGPYETT